MIFGAKTFSELSFLFVYPSSELPDITRGRCLKDEGFPIHYRDIVGEKFRSLNWHKNLSGTVLFNRSTSLTKL